MKASIILVCLGLLGFVGYVHAQRFPTNDVSQAKAVDIASRLWAGMKEDAVAEVLDKQNGLRSCGDAGDSFGWTRSYLLSNGCFLDLQMDPKPVRITPHWGGHGVLKSASIQSNGVEIVSIALTNAP